MFIHHFVCLLVFSLCSTALYSCSTEDFVCMEMSVAALWGNAQRAELFDAWPFVERCGETSSSGERRGSGRVTREPLMVR